MKFTFDKEKPDNKTYKFTVTSNSQEITFKEATQLLKESEEFRNELTKQLIEVPFEGFYWEVKPVTLKTLNEPFEFVTVYSRRFATITANSKSFVQYFKENEEVVTFENLKGDALLVVPTDKYKGTNYAHIAGFLRTGNQKQINEFWIQIGINYENLVDENKLWLSTAGLGVHWLHVRFDQRPKYYRYAPYKL